MKIWNVISGVASTLFVASILTFGLSTEIASAHDNPKKPCTGHHQSDPTCDPTTNTSFSIASVGKWHGRAAREYAIANEGTYTTISSSRFGKKLAKAKGDFSKLCTDYSVLIFEWDSPNIKNLDWPSLVGYMECGGLIVWEDTTNIVKMNEFSVTIINHDGSAESPIEVHFDNGPSPDCVSDTPSLCDPDPVTDPEDFDPIHTEDPSFYLVNSHIQFTSFLLPLKAYLIQDSGSEVIGVYGVFPDDDDDGLGGCIVMTGPDNNFHGDKDFDVENPDLFDLRDAHKNMHALLFHQLDWLLSDVCNP